MSKKLRELFNQIKEKKVLAKGHIENNEMDKAKAIKNEIDELRVKAELLQDLEDEEDDDIANKIVDNKVLDMDDEKTMNNTHVRAFAKMLAKKPLTDIENQALSSNTDEDGGYLIPKDVKTKINLLQKENVSLRSLVRVEAVTTKSGSRVIEADAENNGFKDMNELENILKTNPPKFEKIEYNIRDLGGIMLIPGSLLEDETGELVNYIANWFTKKQYATDNEMILNSDGSKGSEGIFGSAKLKKDMGNDNVFEMILNENPITYKEMKSYINKGFRRPIAKKSKIVTNQSGLDYLDGLEDKNGRPYLTGDGTEGFPYKFKGRVIEVYDDETIVNTTKGELLDDTLDDADTVLIPFILGDLKSGMVLFDRDKSSVASSKEAGFLSNSTVMRGIVRQDCRVWDNKAVKIIYSPEEE